jgi:hypothetical protein
MAKGSQYIVWVERDSESIFGPASNPVIRNGALLRFDDRRLAHLECDRLNAHQSNPHIRYSIRLKVNGRRARAPQ